MQEARPIAIRTKLLLDAVGIVWAASVLEAVGEGARLLGTHDVIQLGSGDFAADTPSGAQAGKSPPGSVGT
jgi:hypothetical protein